MYLHDVEFYSRCCQCGDDFGIWGSDSPGRSLVIVYGYTKNLFIAGTLLVFKTKSENRNYHNEMNFEKFWRWDKKKLTHSC
jgi:hypothetical protein